MPIAVHLDHATTAEALELAIGFAEKHGVKFDSIMVDASHADVSGTGRVVSCRAVGFSSCPSLLSASKPSRECQGGGRGASCVERETRTRAFGR